MNIDTGTTNCPGAVPQHERRSFRIRRIARLLWWLPVVLFIPLFLLVGEVIPATNRGSISDGFRRLNAFLATALPLFGICWSLALGLTAFVEVQLLKGARRTCFIVGVSLIFCFLAVAAGALWLE